MHKFVIHCMLDWYVYNWCTNTHLLGKSTLLVVNQIIWVCFNLVLFCSMNFFLGVLFIADCYFHILFLLWDIILS